MEVPKGDGALRLSANAIRVLEKRYLARDESGRVIETPEQMFRRVARNIAEGDAVLGDGDPRRAEEEFYGLMARLDFLPNSPTLMNAGRDLQQLSACFVLPVGDSMEEIFESVKQAAIIHKSGGGTGFSFSRLRPKADVVRSTGGVASGPVSFMKVFNHATEAVKQGGTRRGANMGILRVDHPDIEEFVTCKDDTREVTNFNISVAVTDAFMQACKEDRPFALINPRSKKAVREVRARDLMDKIAYQAWRNGEPGLFFVDAANRTNPTPHVAAIEATNPCGEQPLLPYESCNLGSINLETHVRKAGGRYEIDWAHLEASIRTSVRFLDNVIEMNRYPIPEIERITRANRKIGLGVMGFSRLLFFLGIPYDSEEGLAIGRSVMRFIREVGYDESARLAERRGVYAFWEGSMHQRQGFRLRNSYVTTVAPTGTISMIADTSGGCEPEFSLIWYKNVMGGEHLPYVLDYFIQVARREGFWKDGLMEKILAHHGSCRGIPEVPEYWQRVFASAHDIMPHWHVLMQGAFQEYSDSAVSKTINLPREATVQDVKQAYLMAFDLGCKGITVYRDGSREEQVLNVGKSQKEAGKTTVAVAVSVSGPVRAATPAPPPAPAPVAAAPEASVPPPADPAPILLEINSESNRGGHADGGGNGWQAIQPKPRPKNTFGMTSKNKTSCGDLYVTINRDETGRPFEAFCTMGKAGGCEGSYIEAIGRLISLALRCGADFGAIERQLVGIRCDKPFGVGKDKVLSCADAVAKAIHEYRALEGQIPAAPVRAPETAPAIAGGSTAAAPAAVGRVPGEGKLSYPCPDCGLDLEFVEGCEKCHFCGYSRCS